MIAPLLVLFISLAGLVAALVVPDLADLRSLAGLCALIGLFLALRARARRGQAVPATAPKWVVVDGSNVMHWRDGTPRIETAREVVDRLTALGYAPGVVFDANAGYLVAGKYRHDRAFGRLLGLPEDLVMVVPRGTPADPFLLTAARDLGARIVTNDRFRDWADAHPEVREPGRLIRGEYRAGKLWLDIAEAERPEGGKVRSA